MKGALLLLALLVPAEVVGQSAPQAVPFPELIGITKPARTASLGPSNPQILATVHVREGMTVIEDDPIFSFDDTQQRLRVASASATAESDLDVRLAEAKWQKAKLEFEWFRNLDSGNNASSKELNDARADMNIARLEYELARFELQQSRRNYEREKQVLDELHHHAPFSGYVAEIMHEPGEALDQQEVVLSLVQLDPLHILIDCPISLAHRVKVGESVDIHPVDVPWSPRKGEVLMKQQVANAASQTFRVKISVDNPDLTWMAGVKVAVLFADRLAHRPTEESLKATGAPKQ